MRREVMYLLLSAFLAGKTPGVNGPSYPERVSLYQTNKQFCEKFSLKGCAVSSSWGCVLTSAVSLLK